MKYPKRDMQQEITNSIITAIEAGTPPWRKPWNSGARPLTTPLKHDGTAYRGINTLMLWMSGSSQEFASNYWMTFRQAQQWKGAHVRKGSKGSLSVFFKPLEIHETNAKGEDELKTIPLMRAYSVFNADQIEGLPERYYSAPVDPYSNPDERNAAADSFVQRTRASIQHDGGNRAFYRPASDDIHMPAYAHFEGAESYYSTLLHELTHWTGAKHRLDRKKGAQFADDAYAFEELIAELGAAFLCAETGISNAPRPDHASYLESWLKCLKSDKRAIFQAASAAQKAATYICDLQTAKPIQAAA